MIYGIIPVGGAGTRLRLPFSKEMLPQTNTTLYIPVISQIVDKMKEAGAKRLIFVHGSRLKTDIADYFCQYDHVTQSQPGFARVLETAYEWMKDLREYDTILFGLPDTIFTGNPFLQMIQPGIVCGLFKTTPDTPVDRLNLDRTCFQIKTPKTDDNLDWFWGVIKMNGNNLMQMVEDKVFDQETEIGVILNRYQRTHIYGDQYLDLGTWGNLNRYWEYGVDGSKCHLEVDWAYAVDYYSILLVKWQQHPNDQNESNLDHCWSSIQKQLGGARANEIQLSPEFATMMEANRSTFQAVERARIDPTFTAKELDDINMRRHKAKQALQARFFAQPLTEVKT